LKDVFLFECKVVEGAVYRVLFVRLGVFVAGNDFNLRSLYWSAVILLRRGVTYQSIDVAHPHEHATFAGMLPQRPTLELAGYEIDEDVLAPAVKCPDNFSPGNCDSSCEALPPSQHVLPEEEQIPCGIIIHGATMFLNSRNTFYHVSKMELLLAIQLR
jgi:hypothetical protein